MALDIQRHLERARRSLEKNKLREAVTEYETILTEAPTHAEAEIGRASCRERVLMPV